MILQLFSIYDSKMHCYLSPFPSRAKVEAVRQIKASFESPQMRETPIFQNPEDFELHHIGEFDDETGLLVSFPGNKHVAYVSDLLPQGNVGTGST